MSQDIEPISPEGVMGGQARTPDEIKRNANTLVKIAAGMLGIGIFILVTDFLRNLHH